MPCWQRAGRWLILGATAAGKTQKNGCAAGGICAGKIYYGIKTGLNEAFVIDAATRERLIAEDGRSREVIKPFLAGRDVKRYVAPKTDKFLIFTRRGIDIAQYPAILKYLEQFKDRLMPQPKEYTGKDWPGRKAGTYKWYEIQDAVDYYGEFERGKILYQEIATYQAFTYDTSGVYCNNKIFFIPGASLGLLGLLNAKLVWFYLDKVASKLQGGAFAMQSPYVLSIPVVKEVVEDSKFEALAREVLRKKEIGEDTAELEKEMDGMVFEAYGLGEGEIGVVEG